jgi:hypothetical protein
VCNHIFIVEKILWLEGKANQDQPLDLKNKSQPFYLLTWRQNKEK